MSHAVGAGAAAGMEHDAALDRHFARRGYGEEFAMEARWIAERVPTTARRVLDLGCGAGALFPWIGVSRIVGLDNVHQGLLHTRSRNPGASLGCGDCAKLPFANESFEAIMAQHVIEHLDDADAACAEWRRVLRIRGLLLIVTPNARFADPSVFEDPTHKRLFACRELLAVLGRSRFKVEEICTLGLPWFRWCQNAAGGWRLRRGVLRGAETLAKCPGLRNQGQSLCCMARRLSI